MIRTPDGKWRFGDSRAARATLRPLDALEVQGSVAKVHSPEHRAGAGGDAHKISTSARGHDKGNWGERYALVEWARTSELDGAFVFRSALAEATVRRGRWGVAYRLEQTERPEEERLSDPFRSLRRRDIVTRPTTKSASEYASSFAIGLSMSVVSRGSMRSA